jgi:uncharacterized protein YnzC (UPF0291/DUF896 family)
MAVEAVTAHVPHALYVRFEERARQTQRSVEEERIEALAEAVSLDDDSLPSDVVAALQPLDTMSDEALWQVARTSHLSPAAAAHLEELNHKRQREALTSEERQIAEALRQQYERAMLVRAEAMAKLKERGHDISALLEPGTA